MKKLIVGLLLVVATFVATIEAIDAGEADKGLAPGWLSLDSSVGVRIIRSRVASPLSKTL